MTHRARASSVGLLAVVLVYILCSVAKRPALAVESDPSAGFDVTLRPVVARDGEVTAIEVDSILNGTLEDGAEALQLTIPVVFAGAYGIADRVRNLSVTDRRGEIQMEFVDDPVNPSGFPWFRHFTAKRDVSFPVRIEYHMEVEPFTTRRGPPFNVKSSKGGVSGGGAGLLIIPENVHVDRSRVRWDLGEFPPGALGAGTFGEGSFELQGAPSALWPGWYMAGAVQRHPEAGVDAGFTAYWLGDFPFDPREEMGFLAAAYDWLGRFFGHPSPPPSYRVFMRVIDSPQTRFSGTALGNSFLLSGGPDSGQETNDAPPRDTFVHEMIHLWVGQIEGPQGITSWFSEGLTSYYTLVLPARGRFESVDELAMYVNELAEEYYTSPGLGESAQAIAAVGFSNEEIRKTPYSRGAMYFADLDARIRSKSGGNRDLDDLIVPILKRRDTDPGFHFDHDAWSAAVTGELGADATVEFTARIIEGQPFDPVPDAFGPCFARHETRYSTAGGEVAGYKWIRELHGDDEQCLRR